MPRLSAASRNLVILALILNACTGEGPTAPAGGRRKAGVVLTAQRDTLNAIGQQTTIGFSGTKEDGQPITAQDLTWESFEPQIASVKDGVVTAAKPGEAHVVASVGYKIADTVTIVVRQVFAGLRLAWSADTLFVTDTISLSLSARDSNNYPMPVPEEPVFTSDAPQLVAHGNGPVFQAISLGSASLRASIKGVTTTASILVDGPFVQVATGGAHACALLERGEVYCWGQNFRGQVGVGTNQTGGDQHRPLIIRDVPRFRSIFAGPLHTCALTAEGEAWCWGASGFWKALDHPTPLPTSQWFTSVGIGNDYGCALTAAGEVWCWGWNQDGQTGQTPTGVGAHVDVPTRVPDLTVKSIAVGTFRTCGLTTEGAAYCWGAFFGPTPVRWGGSRTFTDIALGGSPICGLLDDGSLYCDPTSDFQGLVSGVTGISGIWNGGGHGCGFRPAGHAFCWGWNYYGQLGNSFRFEGNQRASDVAGSLVFRQLSPGGTSTCGVTGDGAIYCWGSNADAQLGPGGSVNACGSYTCSLSPHRLTRMRNRDTQPF